jgi:hypothetical protein
MARSAPPSCDRPHPTPLVVPRGIAGAALSLDPIASGGLDDRCSGFALFAFAGSGWGHDAFRHRVGGCVRAASPGAGFDLGRPALRPGTRPHRFGNRSLTDPAFPAARRRRRLTPRSRAMHRPGRTGWWRRSTPARPTASPLDGSRQILSSPEPRGHPYRLFPAS